MPKPLTKPAALFGRAWYGIDPGAELTVARSTYRFGRLRIRTWCGTQVPTRIRRAISQGTRCCAALPAEAGLVIPLSPPALPPSKLRRILPSLLDILLPFPSEQCATALTAEPPQTVGLAVRHDHLQRAVEALNARGLDAERLVPQGWVLWRQSIREFPAAHNADTAACAVVWTSGERWTVVTGKGTSYGTVGTLPHNDYAGLKRTLHMALGGAANTAHILCAGDASTALVEELRSWAPNWQLVTALPENPATFLARALACDACEDPHGALQLRQPPHAHRRIAAAVPRAMRIASAIVSIAALALIFTCLIANRALARSERIATAQLDWKLERIAGYKVRTKGTRAVQEAREALDQRIDTTLERFNNPRTAADLIAVLAAAENGKIKITHLSLDPDGLALSGRAQTEAAAKSFADACRRQSLRVRMEAEPAGESGTNFMLTPEAGP